jgi:hypothetical protein
MLYMSGVMSVENRLCAVMTTLKARTLRAYVIVLHTRMHQYSSYEKYFPSMNHFF